jgi:hypothetical protein
MLSEVLRPFLALMLLFGNLGLAQASPPPNDNFTNAIRISSLPFTTTVDASAATFEANEPSTCLLSERTVWYTFTAADTTALYVDGAGDPNTSILVHRAAGPGMENLQSIHAQCGSWSTEPFPVEAGQTYYLQVSPLPGAAGNVQFRIGETIPLHGRVVDAVTGEPLIGESEHFTQVYLYRVCGPDCREWIATRLPDSEGRFQFDVYPALDSQPETYILGVYAHFYYEEEFGPFTIPGAPQDVGDLLLDRFESIGSISGHVLERATEKPIPQSFAPVVKLERCFEGYCDEEVNTQAVDRQGRFRFENDALGKPLTIGTYRLTISAEQYQATQTEIFEVTAGTDHKAGTIRLRSFPVRFSDLTPCADVPASGGECPFSIRIWNGIGTDLEGAVWSIMDAYLPNSPGSLIPFTRFQLQESRSIELARGRSKVFHFRFEIPPDPGPYESSFCISFYMGRGGNPYFNTLASAYFCFRRDGNSLLPLSPPAADEHAQVLQVDATPGTDSEPNNSCQAAQDAGMLSSPFHVTGALDSSLEPDIDFYRFRGTAGDPVMIELEGQATGAGTLGIPLLGVFNSDCELIDSSVDHFTGISRLVLRVPQDGVFILAATESFDFDYIGGGNGTYRLTASPLGSAVSISGTLVDAYSGEPLPGDHPAFGYVNLVWCSETDCAGAVAMVWTGSDGRFRFDDDWDGLPLQPGRYVVVASANQYRDVISEPFTVGEGEEVDLGNIALQPWMVQLSNAQGCVIPAEGGVCEFSVMATNRSQEPFSGKAWSLVTAFDFGSVLDWTEFRAGAPIDLRLAPGESSVVHFRFRVRADVSEDAAICPYVYVGQNPDPYFHLAGTQYLFCLTKGHDGLTRMSPDQAQATFLKMQELRFNLNNK